LHFNELFEAMRKLKLQVQITIDGFISGANGEMDWMCFQWSEDIMEYVRALTEPVDTILLGRKLAEGFIPHWEQVAMHPEHPEHEAGLKFASTPKVVFSKSIQQSIWDNAIIASGDLAEEITKLKSQPGNDLIAYGGGSFVSSLIEAGLIDEFHLFVNPTAIGKGMSIFGSLSKTLALKPKKAKLFDCGITLLCYERSN
jgi:dihydrofolate reductase